jgi:hypothetical protein
MSQRIGLFVVLCAVSLTAVALFGQAQGPTTPPAQAQTPTIISGSDLGFRVDGLKGTTPIGTLMVRINGQWVEVEFGPGGVRRLTAR